MNNQLSDFVLSCNGKPIRSLRFMPSADRAYMGVYAQYSNSTGWTPVGIELPFLPTLQQARDANRNILLNAGSYENAHFYLRSAEGNNVTTAFYTNADGGAIQSGDANGFSDLHLQPLGGMLNYRGSEVATFDSALVKKDMAVTDFNTVIANGIYTVSGNLTSIPNYPHIQNNNNGATSGILMVYNTGSRSTQFFYPDYESRTLHRGGGHWYRRTVADPWEYKNGVLEMETANAAKRVMADDLTIAGDYMVVGTQSTITAAGYPDAGTHLPLMITVRKKFHGVSFGYSVTQEAICMQESSGNLTRKWIRSRFNWNGGNSWDAWNEVALLRDVYSNVGAYAIQNQNASAQQANAWINGNFTANGSINAGSMSTMAGRLNSASGIAVDGYINNNAPSYTTFRFGNNATNIFGYLDGNGGGLTNANPHTSGALIYLSGSSTSPTINNYINGANVARINNNGIGINTDALTNSPLTIATDTNAPVRATFTNASTGSNAAAEMYISTGANKMAVGATSAAYGGTGILTGATSYLYGSTKVALLSDNANGYFSFGLGGGFTEYFRIDSLGAKLTQSSGRYSMSDASYLYGSNSGWEFLSSSNAALSIKTGAHVISDSYADTAPTNGLYVKGRMKSPTLASAGNSIVVSDNTGTLYPLTTLTVSNGGTGATSLTGVVLGNGTSAMTAISSSTASQLLRRNTANTGYEFFTPNYLTTETDPIYVAADPNILKARRTFVNASFTLDQVNGNEHGFAYADGTVNAGINGSFLSFGQLHYGSGYQAQFIVDYLSDEFKFRSRNGNNGTWRSWKSVVSSANLGAYAIQNQNASAQASSFWINGQGKFGSVADASNTFTWINGMGIPVEGSIATGASTPFKFYRYGAANGAKLNGYVDSAGGGITNHDTWASGALLYLSGTGNAAVAQSYINGVVKFEVRDTDVRINTSLLANSAVNISGSLYNYLSNGWATALKLNSTGALVFNDKFGLGESGGNLYLSTSNNGTATGNAVYSMIVAPSGEVVIGGSSGNTATSGNSVTIYGNTLLRNGTFIGDSNTSLNKGASNSLKVGTNSGYVEIGPKNTGWTHYETDRPAHYFNKSTHIDGTLQIFNTTTGLSNGKLTLSEGSYITGNNTGWQFLNSSNTPRVR